MFLLLIAVVYSTMTVTNSELKICTQGADIKVVEADLLVTTDQTVVTYAGYPTDNACGMFKKDTAAVATWVQTDITADVGTTGLSFYTDAIQSCTLTGTIDDGGAPQDHDITITNVSGTATAGTDSTGNADGYVFDATTMFTNIITDGYLKVSGDAAVSVSVAGEVTANWVEQCDASEQVIVISGEDACGTLVEGTLTITFTVAAPYFDGPEGWIEGVVGDVVSYDSSQDFYNDLNNGNAFINFRVDPDTEEPMETGLTMAVDTGVVSGTLEEECYGWKLPDILADTVCTVDVDGYVDIEVDHDGAYIEDEPEKTIQGGTEFEYDLHDADIIYDGGNIADLTFSLTYGVDDLPDGLELDEATGIISGTPTDDGCADYDEDWTGIDMDDGCVSEFDLWWLCDEEPTPTPTPKPDDDYSMNTKVSIAFLLVLVGLMF